jgi:hypothetical protein
MHRFAMTSGAVLPCCSSNVQSAFFVLRFSKCPSQITLTDTAMHPLLARERRYAVRVSVTWSRTQLGFSSF